MPGAERIVCHAATPPLVLRELARRGVHVDVVTRCDLETWQEMAASEPRLHSQWELDPTIAYDLALLWDPAGDREVRAWLQDLERLQLAPREIAVRSRSPWSGGAPFWPLVDLRLRGAQMRLGENRLSLPAANRVRQFVGWESWTRTPLLRHKRSHRAWKGWLQRQPAARWFAPARLRRAARAGTTPAPSVLDTILTDAAKSLGGTLLVERLLVSPNGVAIGMLRGTEPGSSRTGILKIPYVLGATGRVARNASGLEWTAQHADELGRWSNCTPRLLASGSVGAWTYTVEERVAGVDAQSWDDAAAVAALQQLGELLALLAQLGAAPRPLDATDLDRTIGRPIRLAATLVDAGSAVRLHEIGAALQRRLLGVPLPQVPRHGDFKLENVLGMPDAPESLRVVDWELWSPDGLPLLDAWHLVASRRARATGCSMGTAVQRWLILGSLATAERRVIDLLAANLDPRYVAVSPLLYWLDRVAPVAARGAWPVPGWERTNVLPVLDAAEALLANRTEGGK